MALRFAMKSIGFTYETLRAPNGPRHAWSSMADILRSDVTDGILCDIGMPVPRLAGPELSQLLAKMRYAGHRASDLYIGLCPEKIQ